MTTTTTTTSEALTVFAFNGASLRGGLINDEPLFVAKDVCEVLNLDYRKALQRVPEWAKGCPVKGGTLGGVQALATLKEAGVYWLVLRSDETGAESFQRWVCEEVLPAIRRNGGYVIGGTSVERVDRLRELLFIERNMLRLERRKTALLEGATPDGYEMPLEGGVVVIDWMRERHPGFSASEYVRLTQMVTRRIRRLNRPVGKLKVINRGVVATALPDDIAANINAADFQRRN